MAPEERRHDDDDLRLRRSIDRLLLLRVCAVCVCSVSADPKTVSRTVYDVSYVTTKAGHVVEKKVARQAKFQTIMKKQMIADPDDETKQIEVQVPVEVEYKPANTPAGRKLNKLKKKLQALRAREFQLQQRYARAATGKIDWPVLEDGAPAKPDRQQIAMAQELYGELEATSLPKAKNIREDDLAAAAKFAQNAGNNRQAIHDFFTDMSEKMLVPEHAWKSTM